MYLEDEKTELLVERWACTARAAWALGGEAACAALPCTAPGGVRSSWHQHGAAPGHGQRLQQRLLVTEVEAGGGSSEAMERESAILHVNKKSCIFWAIHAPYGMN